MTGPTGSGKTTTLYSSLLQIQSPETKIITTEDPVEYQLDGINQIQVHSKIGFTFAHSLRSILRHDPDIVLVGEIRDLETAENAIQASLTGHLVFSTLHTNDAAGAFTRMSDMGVEPFLVAGTVEGGDGPATAATACASTAKQPYHADRQKTCPPISPGIGSAIRPIYRNVGCRECRNVGYTGRMGIYELLVANDDDPPDWPRIGSAVGRFARPRSASACERCEWTLGTKSIPVKRAIDEVLRVTKGEAL